ncbi:MAG: phosphoribosylanthranilate isomerase [Verrucomicrobiota bacterium]|nr:phosphoribosylanthranilate isomerase [Verrucomicrobiota bacterium]
MFDRDDRPLVRPRVKICGITNVSDARAAIDGGADALGFNFFPGSKRYLPVTEAGWIAELPVEVVKVAVLVNASWDEAISIAAMPFVDALQLHGSEGSEFCRRLAEQGIQFAKAIPVMAGHAPGDALSFFTQTVILDSSAAGEFGGSGRTFPWELAREFLQANPDLRVILAGGLTPENVAGAVKIVRPFGVDVTTGVESSPGRKDHGLLRAFIAAATRS